MSGLSIRKLPVRLEQAIKREARRQAATKTEVVVRALEHAFGVGDSAKLARREHLRSFFGKMSREEYESFVEATRLFEEIDEDLWK